MMYLRPVIITREELAEVEAAPNVADAVERMFQRRAAQLAAGVMQQAIQGAFRPPPPRPVPGTDWVWETHPESRMFEGWLAAVARMCVPPLL